MPVKNAQNTLLSAIESILKQTLTDFELIIINDHSTDISADIINSLNDARIKYIDNASIGIAPALNTGINHAKCKYIARMDADDISYPTRLEKQLAFLEKNPEIDVVSCLVKHMSIAEGNQQGYATHIEWLNSFISSEEHYTNRFIDAPVAHPSVFFRKSLIDSYGTYTLATVPEDFELWLRWMEHGVKFAKVPEILFQWSDYPGRTSRTNRNYDSNKFSRLKARYFSRWWQKNQLQYEIWIWGYGKEVFRKSNYLTEEGIEIKGYIDIKNRPDVERNVIYYDSVETNDNRFILVYVGDREGKRKILEFLKSQGKVVGDDYLFMS
jgi:glycosyltransferase involved in cell wall biosynthesis